MTTEFTSTSGWAAASATAAISSSSRFRPRLCALPSWDGRGGDLQQWAELSHGENLRDRTKRLCVALKHYYVVPLFG